MSTLNKCILALQQAGCRVTTEHGSVTVRFPPASDYDPPDGSEMTFTEARFALIVTKSFLQLAEYGIIDQDGEATDFFKDAVGAGLEARREGRLRPWSEVKAELGLADPCVTCGKDASEFVDGDCPDCNPAMPGGHAIGQDWCDDFAVGPDGIHCANCRYPEIGHGEDVEGYQAHKKLCPECQRVKVRPLKGEGQ